MTAEEFYRKRKEGRKLENEYFIAMDKASFFQLMEAYAAYKMNRSKIKNHNRSVFLKGSKTVVEEHI